MRKTVVLSGINLVDGGAYSVYTDCLDEIVKEKLDEKNKIIALVAKKELFRKYRNSNISFIEFPKSKKSWLYRIYYEYIFFNKLSKKLGVDIWISLHDITPNVVAKKRYVYCHNPSPFNRMSIKDIKYGWKYYLFSKFYKYLYQINIHKNDEVIVQQNWLKNRFETIFKLKNVIVAHPSIASNIKLDTLKYNINGRNSEKGTTFIFPSYPRPYKNFELVCEASKKLSEKKYNFKVYLTLDGNENNYSRMLWNKYNDISSIEFVGLLPRDRLYELYAESNCLIFTSKLETWGMPIIEYKPFEKSMILADLPYAHETVGEYDKVKFVDVRDVDEMAKKMEEVIVGNYVGYNLELPQYDEKTYYNNWKGLLKHLI